MFVVVMPLHKIIVAHPIGLSSNSRTRMRKNPSNKYKAL